MTTGWLLLISLFISEINYLSILQMLDSLLNECVHQDFHNRSQCWFLWAVSHLLWNGNELLSQQFFSFFFFFSFTLSTRTSERELSFFQLWNSVPWQSPFCGSMILRLVATDAMSRHMEGFQQLNILEMHQ